MDGEYTVSMFFKNLYFFKRLLCMVGNVTFNHNFFLRLIFSRLKLFLMEYFDSENKF